MNTGDITILANPDVVESIGVLVQGKKAVAVADGPEDPEEIRDGRLKSDLGAKLR